MRTLSPDWLSVTPRLICQLFVSVAALLMLPTLTTAQEVVEYYGHDAIGSVRVVFDATGAVVARHDFTPFGEGFGDSSPIPKERYAGLFRDGEAGLDYAQARMYQSRTGRFTSVDPVYSGLFQPQAWNRYAYALNNPLVFVDPSGMKADNCTWVEKSVTQEDGSVWLSSTLKCPETQGGGGSSSSWTEFMLWVFVHSIETALGGTTVEAGGIGNVIERGPAYRPSLEVQANVDLALAGAAIAVGAATVTKNVVANATANAAEKVAANGAKEAFHYTFSRFLSSIQKDGLRPGSYLTPNGGLSPLQAQIDLALPPNRGLTDVLLRVDLAGLRNAGFEIPTPTLVGRSFNMPGGGYEMQFPYAIPPQFVTLVRR